MTIRARPSRQAGRPLPPSRWFTAAVSLANLLAATPAPARASPPPRPNILVCMADDASYPHMGAYGCRWVRTPGFDRVARDGLLFTRAYTPNAKCAPSRSCLLTGRNSWQLEAAANHIPFFPAKFKSYAEVLGEHGYHVGYTAKGWAPGNPGQANGQPRQLLGPAFNGRTAPPPARGISHHDYAANFRDFLEARPVGRPFCFWYGALEPHRGYEFGSGLAHSGKQLSDLNRVPACWPDNDTVRTDLLDYAFELEHFDQHVQRMLDLLEARGELANTLVLVTADNGMPFPRAKGQAYEASNHLPLAIMWHNGIRKPGRVVNDFVSFIDFAPTFLEVAGIPPAVSGMQPITGRSLVSLCRSEKAGQVDPARDHVLIGKERHDVGRPHDWGFPIRGIVTRDYLYLHNFEPGRWPAGNPETGYLNCDGSPTKTECLEARTRPGLRHFWEYAFGRRPAEELYDLVRDADCLTNLVSSPAHGERAAEFKARLFQALTTQGDPRMTGAGHVFDEYPYADATTRGFHERFSAGEQLKAGWINASDYDPGAAAD